MKEISCFTCLYGSIGSAEDGASPDYLEECKNYAVGEVVDDLLELVFDNEKSIIIRGKLFSYVDVVIEDKLPRFCGCWVEDPSIAAVDKWCREMEAADGTG